MTRRFTNRLGGQMLGSAMGEMRQYMVRGAEHMVQQAPHVQEFMGAASKTMSAGMRATMQAAKEQAAEAMSQAASRTTAGVKSGAAYMKKETKSVLSSYDIRRPLKYAAASVLFETVKECSADFDPEHDPFKGAMNELEKIQLVCMKKQKIHDDVVSGDSVEIDKLRQKYPVAASAVDVARPVIGTEGAITLGITFNVVTSEGPAALVNCAHAGAKLAVAAALHPVVAEEKMMSFAHRMQDKLVSHMPQGVRASQTPPPTPTVQKPKGIGSAGMELD